MPNTHPQYRLAFTALGQVLHTAADNEPYELDEALHEAACYTDACRSYGWDDQRPYVEPVPGTEPCYWLTCNADLDDDKALVSSWHPGARPLPWPEAAAAWRHALENSDNQSHWRALVLA